MQWPVFLQVENEGFEVIQVHEFIIIDSSVLINSSFDVLILIRLTRQKAATTVPNAP
jgi:hypothetical protein